MSETQRLAWVALSAALRSELDPTIADRFLGGTHTQRLADNLLPAFPAWQVAALRAQLLAGAGGELTPTPTGKRKAHAPYSSSALAINAFGRWLGAEKQLQVCRIDGFEHPLSIEHKLKIAHRGGEANLDCVLQGPNRIVGIESKLTEILTDHDPVPWRPPYATPEMASLLSGGWSDVFQRSLTQRWTPRHLGVEQLIKHALALSSHAAGRKTHLVYCYWEPTNAENFPEVLRHRDELAELQSIVADAQPQLHAISYSDLLAEWERLPNLPEFLPIHLKALRRRYAIAI